MIPFFVAALIVGAACAYVVWDRRREAKRFEQSRLWNETWRLRDY